jgi:hypothetical protein
MKTNGPFPEPAAAGLRIGLFCLVFVLLVGQWGTADAAPRYAGRDPAWPGMNNLSPEEKARLQRQYKEWQSMPPAQKEEMRRRLEDYKRKPPPQQDLYKHRYDQWKQMSPQDRRQLEDTLQHWDRLSPQEQENIRRRFRN